MTEAVTKFIPIFVGLLLTLRGLIWIADGKKGNRRSYFFGIAAILENQKRDSIADEL